MPKLKKIRNILMIALAIMVIVLIYSLFFWYLNIKEERKKELVKQELGKDVPKVIPAEHKKMNFEAKVDGVPVFKEVVFDGLTYDELVEKINKSLNSTLKGQGDLYVKHSLELRVDPYLVVAISLYETGCKWNCSGLVKDCNNVGGIKGYPGCYGGSFKKYNSLDEGIISFVSLIADGYYNQGLTTPDLMAYKYSGGSETWAGKVNNYITAIKTK